MRPLANDLVGGVPAYVRWVGTRWSLSSLATQTIRWFGPLFLAVTQYLVLYIRWNMICAFVPRLLVSTISFLLYEMRQCLSVLWHSVIVALAEYLGLLPGSKAAPQTMCATYLQSMIQSNLPAPLWTLYQRSWSDRRRRCNTLPMLTQSSSLTSLKESAVRRSLFSSNVIPKKESRGQSLCIIFARVQSFLWRWLLLRKHYLFLFISKDRAKEAVCHPNPCSPYLNEA